MTQRPQLEQHELRQPIQDFVDQQDAHSTTRQDNSFLMCRFVPEFGTLSCRRPTTSERTESLRWLVEECRAFCRGRAIRSFRTPNQISRLRTRNSLEREPDGPGCSNKTRCHCANGGSRRCLPQAARRVWREAITIGDSPGLMSVNLVLGDDARANSERCRHGYRTRRGDAPGHI